MANTPTITAKAPTRADLLGGTLDLWPFYAVLEKKATINLGVCLFGKVTVAVRTDRMFRIVSTDQRLQASGEYPAITRNQKLPLAGLILNEYWSEEWPGLDMTLSATSPKGAGLGGSSSLAVCLAGALLKTRETIAGIPVPDDKALVTGVANLEARLLHTPTGTQDHWGAVRGRLNLITYPVTGPETETLEPKDFEDSGYSMLLCHSGKSRLSGLNNWEVFQRFFNNDAPTVRAIRKLGEISSQGTFPARKGQWDKVLELSHREWQVRKSLCPGIETGETRHIDQLSQRQGAWFSRVCGAGGGGVVAIFTPSDRKEAIAHALNRSGARVLPEGIAKHGLEISCQ